MPWVDMKALMEKEGIPLFSLETRTPLNRFDVVGFTLQYEMSYSNILAMLKLGGIPLHTAERTDAEPHCLVWAVPVPLIPNRWPILWTR